MRSRGAGMNKIKAFNKAKYLNQFKKELLLHPSVYYRNQGLKLKGANEWRSALCPFHPDTKPSLRLRLDSGGFRCMVCGAHGGDVLSFHMQRYNLSFVAAAKALGAWGGQ